MKQKNDLKHHVQKYQADGFTLKQAKEEAEMVMLPGDQQIVYKVSGISKDTIYFPQK